jgi:hypothetical protein
LLLVLVLTFFSAASAYANHSKGGRQSSASKDLYAASAGLNAKTSFHPASGTCVFQALTISETDGNAQAEVGLARCAGSGSIDGTCDGGYKYIEIEFSPTNYQCYQKGAFVQDHVYNASISAPAPNYTQFKGIIDGESVNAAAPFIYQSPRDTNAMGEVNGNGACPTANLTMRFGNWTKWTLSGGGVYVTGSPFQETQGSGESVCFQGGSITSTGDFSVTLY